MFRKKIIIIFVILSLACCSSCSSPNGKNITKPVLSENTILMPSLELQDESLEAGKAFAVELEDEKVSLVLTALHLFGENGGLKEQIISENLPNVLKKASFADAYSDNACGECEKVLMIRDANTDNINQDIVALYFGEKLNANRLKLSSKLPRKGDIVWLASPTMASTEPKLHRAVIKSASDKMLLFEYEEKDIILQATSGAPIINASGEVVGLNIGGGKQNSNMIGSANPCTSIIKMLKKALK